MSSWFDQLDIGVDLNALQEHIALSLEEAGEIVDSLGRMEIMNLDEMAEKQEAEENEDEIIEEIIVHHDDEDLPGEVIHHDDQFPSTTINHLSGDNLNTHLIPVSDEHADAPISFVSQFHRPFPSRTNLKTQSGITKVITKETKKQKRKKKQKTLDFFGTSAYDDNDDNNHIINHDLSTNNINHHALSHLSTTNAFDNDVGFALGSLFDVEMPSEEIATHVSNNHYINGVANQTQKNDDISSYLSTFFSGSHGIPDGSGHTGDTGPGVVSSVLSMTLPTSFSFFDTIDEEINLEEDPILQQVERNRTLGIVVSSSKPSYISYLESVLPPPARLFGFESDDANNSTVDDVEDLKRRQQQQQQVDRILGLTGGRMRSSSSAVASSSSSIRNCAGYTRNCLIQSNTILSKDLIVIMSGHVSVGIKSTRESILPFWMEQYRVLFDNLKGIFVPATNRAFHFYYSLQSFYLIFITFLKFLWVIMYAILRILISVFWHIIQVAFLSSLYVIQCLRPAYHATAAAPPVSAEERLQQWRTRWRSFAEAYLSSNNALLMMTAILFVYSYYRFQRYSTDAGD